MVRGWVIEQMLGFKMSNAATTAGVSHLPTAYKTVPEHSTLAISSGLDHLFGTSASSRTLSREGSGSSASERREEWEASTAGRRHKARELECVHQELDEYLEEPLETFSRIESVDGVERVVVFDILTYWQNAEKKVSEPLLPRDGRPTRASEFGVMRTSLLVREGDRHCSPEQNPAGTHGGPTSFENVISTWLTQLDRTLIGRAPPPGRRRLGGRRHNGGRSQCGGRASSLMVNPFTSYILSFTCIFVTLVTALDLFST